MSKWSDNDLAPLSPIEAYDAMQFFLRTYWERGGKNSDDIANLLSDIGRNQEGDLPPIDIAQWHDWLSAIETVQNRRPK